ncbi:MAG: hypothetical protein PHV59_10610 [Victivallales bacterium]|nr:hypothetical protein [Victivallales bacterium]
MDCDLELFKSGPWVVRYRGKMAGKTCEAPRFEFRPELYAAKSMLADGGRLRNVIANVSIKVMVRIRSVDIDLAFAKVSGDRYGSGNLVFADGLLLTGGELAFQCFRDNASAVKNYRFPKAVLATDNGGFCRSEGQAYFELIFEVYEDARGILIQEYSSL